MSITSTETLGWSASIVLLATLVLQVRVQWSEHSTAGVSAGLFIGQLLASVGLLGYAWLLDNTVLVVTNTAQLLTAFVGQWVFLRNRRREKAASLELRR